MRRLYRLFRSVKLAVALLLLLTALAALLAASGLTRLFRSWLFLLPGALLFANLAVCTIARVVERLRGGQRVRFGTELVHAGLLLLIAGGLL